ncbi:MAG: hypothetical protein AAB468_02155 [Patescibacteria group bacterium]
MSPEKKFEQNTWLTLEKTREKLLYLKEGSVIIRYSLYCSDNDSPIANESLILQNMERLGLIKILPSPPMEYDILKTGTTIDGKGFATVSLRSTHDYDYIEVQRPAFDEFYVSQQKKKSVLMLNKTPNSKNADKIIFHYDRGTNELSTLLVEKPYTLKDGTKRKIIEKLIDWSGGFTAKELGQEINKSPAYVSKEIGELKNMIEKHFKVSGSAFLPNSTGGGYKLGRGIKLLSK